MNKIYFLVGPPLSGKDTQGKLLAKKLGAKFLVTSKIVENFFKKQKKGYLKIGKQIFDIKKEQKRRFSGGLYSPKLVGYIISEKIKELISKRSLVFAGSPRTVTETKMILKTLRDNNIDFRVIFLKISEEEIFKRALKRKRGKEDYQKIVEERIESYKKYTIPTINFLRKRYDVLEINGEASIRKIHQEILSKIKS
jgi:adenylate kinase family enzyme